MVCVYLLTFLIISCVFSNIICGPGSSVGIATDYGLDGRGSNPDWDETLSTSTVRPWESFRHLYNWYWIFPGCKERRGITLTTNTLLVPMSRRSRVIPLLPLWAVLPVHLSACTKVHFTFSWEYGVIGKFPFDICQEMCGNVVAFY